MTMIEVILSLQISILIINVFILASLRRIYHELEMDK